MSTAFQVGDRVKIPLGRRKVAGVISEDRGSIGVHGRRLYQVLVPMDPFEPTAYELPENEIEALSESANSITAIDAARVIDYLKNGGLISILQSNRSGGRNQPRVWLCLDSLGNVTHTFLKERGLHGGETVPFLAVYEDHVFSPKQDEVSALLRSFGLDASQADEIIASVGTYPMRSKGARQNKLTNFRLVVLMRECRTQASFNGSKRSIVRSPH